MCGKNLLSSFIRLVVRSLVLHQKAMIEEMEY